MLRLLAYFKYNVTAVTVVAIAAVAAVVAADVFVLSNSNDSRTGRVVL